MICLLLLLQPDAVFIVDTRNCKWSAPDVSPLHGERRTTSWLIRPVYCALGKLEGLVWVVVYENPVGHADEVAIHKLPHSLAGKGFPSPTDFMMSESHGPQIAPLAGSLRHHKNAVLRYTSRGSCEVRSPTDIDVARVWWYEGSVCSVSSPLEAIVTYVKLLKSVNVSRYPIFHTYNHPRLAAARLSRNSKSRQLRVLDAPD